MGSWVIAQTFQHPDNLYFFPCLCYDGVVATVENGGITKIKGDQDHPGARGHFFISKRRLGI